MQLSLRGLVLLGLCLSACTFGMDDEVVVPTQAVLLPQATTTSVSQDPATALPIDANLTLLQVRESRERIERTDGLQIVAVVHPGSVADTLTYQREGDLVVIRPGSQEVQFLTSDPAQESHPVWGIFGNQLYFVSSRQGQDYLYRLNANDRNPAQRLNSLNTDHETMPAMSPDGAQIAFTSNRSGINSIYLSNIDGRNVMPFITDDPPNYDLTWSPDNNWLVFVSDRDGNPNLYLTNREGTILVRLTDHPGDDIQPDFSPDGYRIVFVSDRLHGIPQIYVIQLPQYHTTFDEAIADLKTFAAGEIPLLKVDPNASVPKAQRMTSDSVPKRDPVWWVDQEGNYHILYTAFLPGPQDTLGQLLIMNDQGTDVNLASPIGWSLSQPAPRPLAN